jgi:serine/threonine-protein kinase
MIWIKSRDRLDPVPIPGTMRGQGMTFSPDGAWLAFVADAQLKKVQVSGGEPIALADSVPTESFNVAWLSDGSLVYAGRQFLRRVSSSGGEPSVVMGDSTLQGAGLYNLAPLPDARGVLFGVCNSGCVTVNVHVLDLASGRQKRLVDGAFGAWYLPDGNLLYARRDGVVLAAPFDLGKLEVTGPAVPVLQNVLNLGPVPLLAWSPSGTMVYLRGAGSIGLELVRVPRGGRLAPVDSGWTAAMNSLALSPDGRRVAVGAGPGAGVLSIFVKQLDRGPFSRLTFGAQDRRPAWSSDGRTVAFIRDSTGGGGVYARPADGTGADRLIGRVDRLIQEFAWSGDGRWLVVRTDNGARGAGDLVGIPLQGDTAPVPLVATPFSELHPAVSPDSKWLAYTSNESGANEVYVRPFPNAGDGRWQVSNGGGSAPMWSPDGSELFFLSDDRLMAAQVRATPGFDVIGVRALFDVSGLLIDPFHQSYAVEPGGQSFLFVKVQGETESGRSAVLVEHWLSEVAARMAQ